MYVIIDKEKSRVGNVRGLNLAAVWLTAVQSPNCSLMLITHVKVLHRQETSANFLYLMCGKNVTVAMYAQTTIN
jgi:hypothetical protein